MPAPTESDPSFARATSSSDPIFQQKLNAILEKWRNHQLAANDQVYLDSVTLSMDDYIAITDGHNLRHGVELKNNHLVLYECATAVHEYVGGEFDDCVMNTYGKTNLRKLRSTSMCHTN